MARFMLTLHPVASYTLSDRPPYSAKTEPISASYAEARRKESLISSEALECPWNMILNPEEGSSLWRGHQVFA